MNQLNFRYEIDDTLSARHVFVCGTTGSGKSTVLKVDPENRNADRVVIWDPDGTHKVNSGCKYRSVKSFKDGLVAALTSGKKFKLSCQVANTKPLFQAFCAVMVRHASSDTPMTMMVEEVQQVTGNAEANGYWSDLLTRARKYAVRLVVISPRPQQCDKTTVTSCPEKVVCMLGSHADRMAMSKDIGVPVEDLRKLGSMNIPRKRIHWYECKSGGLPVLRQHDFK